MSTFRELWNERFSSVTLIAPDYLFFLFILQKTIAIFETDQKWREPL